MKLIKKTIEEKNHVAELTIYLQENWEEIQEDKQWPMIVICPGGGYSMVSNREAEPVALAFLARGFQVAILDYSITPAVFPTALRQLAKSLLYLREHGEEFALATNQIAVLGFSAGGHLAASLGVFWNQEVLADLGSPSLWQPNALLLSYPVITSGEKGHQGSFQNLLGADYETKKAELSIEKKVTATMPPTFIWHTVTDQAVPVKNSLLLAQALEEEGVPFELHLFPEGGHGLSLGTDATASQGRSDQIVPAIQIWPDLSSRWLKDLYQK